MFGPLGADKYHEYCRDIRESGQYLLDVINDILDMSKIEAGRIRLEPETVELDRILADCMRVVLGARRAKSSSTLDSADRARHPPQGRPPRAQADRAQSSVQRGEVHAGRRHASRCAARVRGGTVTIAIEDTGIGIPKDALRKLGRPFEQVESQLTKRHQGSGLGLAIAKSLAELHGGAMRIRSTLGVGTIGDGAAAARSRSRCRSEQPPERAAGVTLDPSLRVNGALTQDPHEARAHLRAAFR